MSDGTVEARVTYRNLGPEAGYRFRGIALLAMFERDGNFGTGLGWGEMLDSGVSDLPFGNT